MTGILELIAKQRGHFVPEDPVQYAALQLAKRLDALDHVQKLVALVTAHSIEDVASMFRYTHQLPPAERLGRLISSFSSNN